jgi:predicted ribosome quality control (RQC) complex YloA/Tae2 family protein
MKTELSALDLYFLVKEFKEIINAKIDKIYQSKNEFLFQLHLPNIGRRYLKVLLPNFIFLSNEKLISKHNGNFALSLRRHLNNTRIRHISQINFERILEFKLEAKDKTYNLIVELFRPGNIILCDQDYKIILAIKYKGFGSRLIRPGIKYDHPKKEVNFLKLSERNLVSILEKSEKSSIVITLAVDLGLGGLYAEELCLRANIDKKKSKINYKEAKRLYKVIEDIKNEKIDATIYLDKEKVIDITPFEVLLYKEKFEKLSSFNTALDVYLSKKFQKAIIKEKKSKFEKEKLKLETIIKKQESQIKGLEKSYLENQRKGELIYEKYTILNKILEEINKARKKYSWKEIIENTKNNKIIKTIDEKEKKIILELHVNEKN